MVSLSQFYSNKANMEAILPYINGNGAISLRMIDWFVTNYVKMNNVILPQPGGRFINVYVSYRMQLKAYSKQQFDPFRRRDRVAFHYDAEQTVETTVGQLNFFRWMLQHKILLYVQENAEQIERAMLEHDSSSSSHPPPHPHPHPSSELAPEPEHEPVINKANARPKAATAAAAADAVGGAKATNATKPTKTMCHPTCQAAAASVLTVRGLHTISFE